MSTTIDCTLVDQFVGQICVARHLERLTALAASRLREPGTYADGGGLNLIVSKTGARSWIFRFMLKGRAREMGLGPFHSVSLAEARGKAADARKLVLAGIDPIDARRGDEGRAVTFKDAADRYITAHESGWRNKSHAKQWTATLNTYAYPILGDLPVDKIDVAAIMAVLSPIWNVKTETASRVRGRMELILSWAKVHGYRHGDNPAIWRGHLENLLPKRARVKKVIHHAALPYDEIGIFVAELRKREATAARAMEFLILTAARTGEALGARWSEINLNDAIWTVPADRIKAGREHRVPLSSRAIEILQRMKELQGDAMANAPVFQSAKKGQPLSNAALLALLDRMGHKGKLTSHGFRSTFRDWAAERTNYPREVAEMALAHAIGDKVEAAYRRGDLFNKRRRMMEEWAKFCGRLPSSNSASILELDRAS